MEDKEAQEKITEEIADVINDDGEYTYRGSWLIAQKIVEQVLTGYHKLPKDKPPLLTGNPYHTDSAHKAYKEAKQAQWDIWNKAIYGGEE